MLQEVHLNNNMWSHLSSGFNNPNNTDGFAIYSHNDISSIAGKESKQARMLP